MHQNRLASQASSDVRPEFLKHLVSDIPAERNGSIGETILDGSAVFRVPSSRNEGCSKYRNKTRISEAAAAVVFTRDEDTRHRMTRSRPESRSLGTEVARVFAQPYPSSKLNRPSDCMMPEFGREPAAVAFHSLTPFRRVIPPLIDAGQGKRSPYGNKSKGFAQVKIEFPLRGKRSEGKSCSCRNGGTVIRRHRARVLSARVFLPVGEGYEMEPLGGNGSVGSTHVKLEFLPGRERTERKCLGGWNAESGSLRAFGLVLSSQISAQQKHRAAKHKE
jgi:hypothetical protein